MSGLCSAHHGHDPACPICAASPPEEVARAIAYYDAFKHGVGRGIDATCEWIEGAQWDEKGQPCKRDPLPIADADIPAVTAGIRKHFDRKKFP